MSGAMKKQKSEINIRIKGYYMMYGNAIMKPLIMYKLI
jgi:hypothetical protein